MAMELDYEMFGHYMKQTTETALADLILARDVIRRLEGPWQCGARSSIDPPQDCDWPLCGCDPYADKVIEALIERGRLQVTRRD
jgi:hypothetical protein